MVGKRLTNNEVSVDTTPKRAQIIEGKAPYGSDGLNHLIMSDRLKKT